MRDTILLMKKSLKQDLRRPKGFTCEMICPMLVFLLFALLRSTIDKEEIPINYVDDTTFGKIFVEYDYKFINTTNRPYQDIARLICMGPSEFSDDDGFYPASYLAVIPSPTSNDKIQYIMNQMHLQWNQSKSTWNPILCETQSFLHPGCREECKYDQLDFVDGSILKYFDSESELKQYLDHNDYASSSWNATDATSDGIRPVSFAIVFDEFDDWDSITYTLRGNASYFPTTEGDAVNKFDKDFNTLYSDGYFRYYHHGMVHIQQWLNQIITEKIAIEHNTNKPLFQYGMYAMPTAGYLTDRFYQMLSRMLAFMMILAFIYPYFVISGAVVQEKASKIKEGLRMMGASTASYWLSIYLYYGIKFTIIAFSCSLISYLTNVFVFSEFSIIFLWFTLFLWTLLTSAIMFSTFFDSPKTASMVSSIFLLTLYFISAAADSLDTESKKTWLCVSGPACFAMSSSNFGKYEEGLIGLRWDNIHEPYEYLRFSTALVMMLVDCVLYTILAMYLDRVIPSKYGQHLPPYFIFQRSFWCKNREYKTVTENGETDSVALMSKKYEQIEKGGVPSIQIRNLRKEFSTGFNSQPVTAVSGISLDVYENEIFCLLGHNGAGKTTTISMLTGMLNITSGSARINGKDVVTEMSQIRESLGVCPQHDVLWPTLTVEEHLALFARLKGVQSADIQKEVDSMIDAIKMQDKRTKYPTQLSGGQKRKLSLGIALIGGSKIVFLDEPTSGMDPHSRRDAWELIKTSCKGRTIILTTHFMDEADILSDRIAIMARGSIECCGSSLFLKRLYGVGYSFTISVNTEIAINKVDESIDDIIKKEIDSAQLLSTHGSELIYRLPFDSSKSFPSMFRLIDDKKHELHIDSYGISVTTLEEVFIKVGHGQKTPTEDLTEEAMQFKDTLRERRESAASSELIEVKAINVNEEDTSDNLSEIRRRSESNLFFVHLFTMLHKKWHYTKRDKRAMLCQVIIPILFMVLGFAIIDLEAPSVYPRIKLDMTHYGEDSHEIPYNNNSLPSINPFPALWHHVPSEYGSLLPLNGGDNGVAYEYDIATGFSLHTYFDSMLAISDEKPFKYISYYFPIHNNTEIDLDPRRHIGIGANVSAYHSLPIAINIASNLALQSISNTSRINAYIRPLPTTKQETATGKQFEAMIYSTYLAFGFAFFPAAIMYNIVYEKENLCKAQLLISGMNSVAYWLGNCIFDIVTILPSCLSAVILIYAFDATSFTGEAVLPFVLIVLLYGISIVPFTYLFSWCFKSSTRAQYIGLISFIFLGYGFSLTTFIMDIFESTRDESQTIKTIVRFSPSYCAAAAMLNLATRDLPFAGLWEVDDPPLEWAITGQLITYMAFEAVLYFVLTLIVEYLSTIPEVNALLGQVTNVPKQHEVDLDEDVKREQDKLKGYLNKEGTECDFSQCRDPIIINGLRKVYNTGSVISTALNRCNVSPENAVTAVKDLWFSVPCGQIFGFLGVNGAGKTTTLSMLCGKHPASEGVAYINRTPISNQIACRRMIGFCPQFDAIFDLLTAREHLIIYGMIKGLNKQDAEQQANELISKLNLSRYADKRAGTYSGGNKRKLSVAIAMIGDPPIVFLDEPSTGMDPVSRRIMWDFISQSMSGRSVILTTHSMEECEALCHRIGIMVKGQLRCLGTSQRLKQRYGKGFQLDVNIKVDKQQQLTDELKLMFDGFDVDELEKHDENIKYTISAANNEQAQLSLADMFEKLQVINEKMDIQGGYALSQTTLEQIFIQMAAQYQ